MRIRLLLNGLYGELEPGSLKEKLAVIAAKESQEEKLAQTRLLVAASVGAEDKDLRESFSSYLWASNPHIHRMQKDKDKNMHSMLKEEAEKGAFFIQVEQKNDPDRLSLRNKPKIGKKRRSKRRA